MPFMSESEYLADRADASRTAERSATDPAIAFAHRELASRYDRLCEKRPGTAGAEPVSAVRAAPQGTEIKHEHVPTLDPNRPDQP